MASSEFPLLRPGHGGGPRYGCADQGIFRVRFIRADLEKPDEEVGFDPIAISLEDSVPKERWKIAPWAALANDPEDRFDKKTMVALRSGSVGFPRQNGSIFAHWAPVCTNRSFRSLILEQLRLKS